MKEREPAKHLDEDDIIREEVDVESYQKLTVRVGDYLTDKSLALK